MKVFISWSGKRSKETAEVLSSWIRQVIQAAETWISLDIDKGTRWNDKINKELEQTKVGIICLNKDNLTSEWILFEAGALSKTSDAHVCTLLLDINPAEVKPPLGQFQHTLFNKEEIKKLIHTINEKIVTLGEKTLQEKDLDEIFEVFWPRLEEKINSIKNQSSNIVSLKRTDREILEEILQIVRENNKDNIFLDYSTSSWPFIKTITNEKEKNEFIKSLYLQFILSNDSEELLNKLEMSIQHVKAHCHSLLKLGKKNDNTVDVKEK